MEMKLEIHLQGLEGFRVSKEEKSKLGGQHSWAKHHGGDEGWE